MKRDESAATGGTRIVLVEDNHDAAESFQVLLELIGHSVSVAHDGATAIDTARSSPPDVMIIDIGLPGMDGYEVARAVRAEPGLEHVVLVALTGRSEDEDRRRALAAGFDHHLVKPVNPDVLIALVAEQPAAAKTRMRQ